MASRFSQSVLSTLGENLGAVANWSALVADSPVVTGIQRYRLVSLVHVSVALSVWSGSISLAVSFLVLSTAQYYYPYTFPFSTASGTVVDEVLSW